MPNVPKWIADQMENLWSSKYLNVRVTETVKYSPEIKKVIFSADLTKTDYHPGESVIFRVSNTELRHYTISSFGKETGSFAMLFHIHGHGPGSELANLLWPGDELKISVPGGRKLYDKEKIHHFVFGDETSLSFYEYLRHEIKRNNQQIEGVLELAEPNLNIPEDLGFGVKTVLKTPRNPGQNAVDYLNSSIRTKQELFKQSVFYLTGNVASVQQVKKTLKNYGISSKNIKVQGYWAEGSVGL